MAQKAISNPLIEKFCDNIDSTSSRMQYSSRLRDFDVFVHNKYDLPIDSFIAAVKADKLDVYEGLKEYRIQLREKGLARNTMANRIAAARMFVEFNRIPFSNTIFRMEVKPPKLQRNTSQKALDTPTVRKIILACEDLRLRVYVLFLAATGCRATEALSFRLKDIEWEAGTVFLRAKFTKTHEDRFVYLTQECLKYLKMWQDYRERERRIVDKHKKIHYVTKHLGEEDLFFSTGRQARMIKNPKNLYNTLEPDFKELLDRIGLSERHDDKGKRHKIHLHRFRAFVKSTISDLGYSDFAEWFIGHVGSTYYRKTEAEKLAIFKKVEPYLTYLDYSALEAHGADVKTQLGDKDEQIRVLNEKVQSLIESKERMVLQESEADQRSREAVQQVQESMKILLEIVKSKIPDLDISEVQKALATSVIPISKVEAK